MRYLFLFLFGCFQISSANAMDSYADLVEQLMPSVVNISTEREIIDDESTDVSNMMLETNLKGREALGSGFFIRKDGYILTNAHVINKAKVINVITMDNVTYEATVIGKDKISDLAVLKISPNAKDKNKAETFTPVVFGNADKARIGDKVLTFGNPYGLGVSVSDGIISAKSRDIGLSEQQYLQTDAAINQGNSGGPMFNLDGEVIGVNAAIFRDNGANGVGFALPSNIANWVSSQLISSGNVQRGWLGITVAKGVDKYTDKVGFVITEINEESSAYKEGLRAGDIIISYNKKNADDLAEFIRFTETAEVGQTLNLTLLSYGEEVYASVKVQKMPVNQFKDVTNKALKESVKYYNEANDSDVIYISELNIAVKEASPRGLSIKKLERGSPLFNKGINVGDIILEVDRTEIYTPDNLLDSIRNAEIDDFRPLSLLIQGTDNTYYSTIELVQEND